MSNYVIQDAPKSHCPHCERVVRLLCPDGGSAAKPWFYICWNCQCVFEVGVGQVEEAT